VQFGENEPIHIPSRSGAGVADTDKEEIAALRAEVGRLAALQGAKESRTAPGGQIAVYGSIVVAAALLFVAAYFGSPFLALHDLQRAAHDGDRDRLEQLVDFPKVRENLKSKFDAYMLGSLRSDPSMANNPFAGLGALIAPASQERNSAKVKSARSRHAVPAGLLSGQLFSQLRGYRPFQGRD
jgi:hypothetical protein